MEKIIYVLIFSFVLIAGCKDGIKLLEKQVSFNEGFDITVPQGGPQSLTVEKTFDASSKPEVQEIIDQIDHYRVDEVAYKVENFIGEPTKITELTITVNSADGTQLAIETINNIDLQAISGAGNQPISFEPEEFEAIEQKLKQHNAINLVVSGEIDNTPVAFYLEFLMNITIEYRVLD